MQTSFIKKSVSLCSSAIREYRRDKDAIETWPMKMREAEEEEKNKSKKREREGISGKNWKSRVTVNCSVSWFDQRFAGTKAGKIKAEPGWVGVPFETPGAAALNLSH